MPGCLMAMARFNRPSIMLYGGTIAAGCTVPNNPNNPTCLNGSAVISCLVEIFQCYNAHLTPFIFIFVYIYHREVASPQMCRCIHVYMYMYICAYQHVEASRWMQYRPSSHTDSTQPARSTKPSARTSSGWWGYQVEKGYMGYLRVQTNEQQVLPCRLKNSEGKRKGSRVIRMIRFMQSTRIIKVITDNYIFSNNIFSGTHTCTSCYPLI